MTDSALHRHGILRVYVHGLVRKPIALIAFLVIVVVSLAVALAPLIAPYGPLTEHLDALLQGPSLAHPLGTDSLGRDILSRLLYGGQPTLLGVLIAIVIFLVSGLTLGILAGYLGGVTDRVVTVVSDLLMAMPGIVLVLAVLAIFSQSLVASMLTLGFLSSGSLIRIVRSSVLSLREELFVSAAVVSGLSRTRVMFRHILPGLFGPVIVQVSLFGGAALGVQTGLGFLGLATVPPAPSWGGMVGEASSDIAQDPFFLVITGGTIAIMTLAFVLLGDGIRDLNAEAKKGPGPRPSRLRSRPSVREPAVAASGESSGRALLHVEDYCVSFETEDREVEVLKSVSFDLYRGEILGLVGESGSGKTVTALSILGLLPPNGRVTGGVAELDGVSLLDLAPDALRRIRGRRIGLVSQEPMVSLDPLFTVGSQLCEVLRTVAGLSRREAKARSEALLARVHLPEPRGLLSRYPHELSGGMIQRVVIALALAGEPELLIADEPTTALDVTVQAEILDLLRDLSRESGMAVIFVTHDLGVVADICDRAVVMSEGRIVESAGIEDLFYRPEDEYTRMLLSSTPNLVSAR